ARAGSEVASLTGAESSEKNGPGCHEAPRTVAAPLRASTTGKVFREVTPPGSRQKEGSHARPESAMLWTGRPSRNCGGLLEVPRPWTPHRARDPHVRHYHT